MLSFSLVLFIFEAHSLMQFRVLSITCAVLGIIASCYYVFYVREDSLSKEAVSKEREYQRAELGRSIFTDQATEVGDEVQMTWAGWL